jgi:DnaJ-class molecular chaperone
MDKKIYYLCQRCAGTGKYKGGVCPDCDGTGRVLFGFLVEKEENVLAKKGK